MRKVFLLALVILGLASVAAAQERTSRDISVGYSYLREGFSNGINANGGNLSATAYVNHWLGITGDFGAYHATPFGVSANTYTFLVGPRFAYRRQERVMPLLKFLSVAPTLRRVASARRRPRADLRGVLAAAWTSTSQGISPSGPSLITSAFTLPAELLIQRALRLVLSFDFRKS